VNHPVLQELTAEAQREGRLVRRLSSFLTGGVVPLKYRSGVPHTVIYDLVWYTTTLEPVWPTLRRTGQGRPR
jgi:hypothetical protein